MSKSALNWDECSHHGRQLFHFQRCVTCEREGVTAPKAQPPIEVPAWMRRVITTLDRYEPGQIKRRKGQREKKRELNRRERQCVELFAKGVMARDIAIQLNCRPCTVSTWLDRARIKKGLARREDLIQWARQGAQT